MAYGMMTMGDSMGRDLAASGLPAHSIFLDQRGFHRISVLTEAPVPVP